MKIAIISLGCPKNQVDADVFCHALIKDGHTTVADPAEADIIIINTARPNFCSRSSQTAVGGRPVTDSQR